MSGLLLLSETWQAQHRPPLCELIGIFGYQEQHSTDMLSGALGLAMRKAHEWRGDLKTSVLSADVKSAFDNVKPAILARALQSDGLHPHLIRCIIGEQLYLQARASLQGTDGDIICYNASMRQGGVESAWGFNAIARMVIRSAMTCWVASGAIGLELPLVRSLTHAIWADNFYLMGRDLHDLALLFRGVTEGLHEAGLRWKADSLEFWTADTSSSIIMQYWHPEEGLKDFKQVEEIQILGVLHCPAEPAKSVDFRLDKASDAFWSMRDFFLCKSVGARQKCSEFRKRILPVALYGACAWQWTSGLWRKLRAWENTFLKLMITASKGFGESWQEFMRRHVVTARKAYHEDGGLGVAARGLKSYYDNALNAMRKFGEQLVQSVGCPFWPAWQAWHTALTKLREGRFSVTSGGVPSASLCALGSVILIRDVEWWRLRQATGTIADP